MNRNLSTMLNLKYSFLALAFFWGILNVTSIAKESDIELTFDMDMPLHTISPTLYGLFFEDINFAADGGLYAEQVQNRSFEFDEALFGWEISESGCHAEVVDNDPLNASNIHYLSLSFNNKQGVAISNSGFGGIVTKKRMTFNFSFYAKNRNSFIGDLSVKLVSGKGETIGKTEIDKSLSTQWKKYTGTIKADANDMNASLVLQINGIGKIDLDMISLFPGNTWKSQSNGLRADLVQMLYDMKPAFFRFPGGCVVEGYDLSNSYNWKDSIGNLSARKVNWNRWRSWNRPPQYYQSLGLGFYEYFRLSEDIGAEPLPILNCGMACQYESAQLVPLDQLGPYVQDALDLIEFANGPTGSIWGSKRAEAGHPEPFNLKYIGVGNEQWGEQYFKRYDIFYKAIKAAYPDIIIITTSGPGSDGKWYDLAWNKFQAGTPADLVDEHYYRSPDWFLQNDDRYDSYDRNGPKVFAGEYAAHGNGKKNTLFTALSEAAFMTGLERNSDVVVMAAYAPLLAKAGYTQWTPDLIFFDNTRAVGTPSYYVQKLFSEYKGTEYLSSQIKDNKLVLARPAGKVGLGTWRTAAEFKDVKVVQSTKELISSPKSSQWKSGPGKWSFGSNIYVQSDDSVDGAVCFVGDTGWENYSLTLKARKVSGREGFIICFRRNNDDDGLQWNIGGWSNTKHAVQYVDGGASSVLTEAPGSVSASKWYDIKIVLNGENVKCYLDGNLIHDLDVPVRVSKRFYASCTRDADKGKVYIKAVNPTDSTITMKVNMHGNRKLDSKASITLLTADNRDMENSLDMPKNVYPETFSFNGISETFYYELKPYSLTVIQARER